MEKGECTYRVDHPWCAVPSGGVDGCPEVEEDDRRDAAAGEVVAGVLRRLRNADVGAYDPHADGTGDGTDEQELPSPELIDQEQQPHKCHDGLDDTEDARHQVHRVGLDAKALQQGLVCSPTETKEGPTKERE